MAVAVLAEAPPALLLLCRACAALALQALANVWRSLDRRLVMVKPSASRCCSSTGVLQARSEPFAAQNLREWERGAPWASVGVSSALYCTAPICGTGLTSSCRA